MFIRLCSLVDFEEVAGTDTFHVNFLAFRYDCFRLISLYSTTNVNILRRVWAYAYQKMLLVPWWVPAIFESWFVNAPFSCRTVLGTCNTVYCSLRTLEKSSESYIEHRIASNPTSQMTHGMLLFPPNFLLQCLIFLCFIFFHYARFLDKLSSE
jgi:hypothetical protein